MSEEQMAQIFAQLADHEERLKNLEGKPATAPKSGADKQKTLRELIQGKKFKNGQQQIAVIVGYHEQVLGERITKDKIKEEWVNAKMTNKYAGEFITRAKDVLIRVHPDETCDLTQSGEEFFESIIN